MVVCGGYEGQWRGGDWFAIMFVPSKNKIGSEFRQSEAVGTGNKNN